VRSQRWKNLWRSELPGRVAAMLVLVVTGGVLGSGLAAAGAADRPEIRTPPHQGPAGFESVAKGLMCTCGCNLTVHACEGAMTCSVAARMKEEAVEMLAQGNTANAVLASFADDYGEQILSAPTKKGFNLAAWVLPFVGLALGALVVGGSLRHWRKHAPDDEPAVPAEVDEAYAALLEREIQREM